MGEVEVLLRTALEEWLVTVPLIPRAPDAEQRAAARGLVFELRFAFDAPETTQVEAVQQLLHAATGAGMPLLPRSIGTSLSDWRFLLELLQRLEQELAHGRLLVKPRRVAQLTERRPPPLAKLPPPPPPAKETGTFSFELRLVDEVGQAITGASAEFFADDLATLSSNAAGRALLEGAQSSSARASLPDPDGLDEILDPRWTKPRPGRPPKEANLREVVFLGGELGPFELVAEVPNTVVIKPPLGKLFAELFDKSGRVLHAARDYTISGPANFSGTTDEAGRLLHELAFPGDYELTLTLEHFKGDPDATVDTVKTQLVVLPAAAGSPQRRQVGAAPRSVLAQLHAFFNTNKTFLLPTALPSVRRLRELYLDNTPCKLLVVGHADTKGGSAYNDKLALARAKSMVAYLKDDVEAWFDFYGQKQDAKNRWGSVEDHLMIIAMPDFSTKPKGENEVKWYQRTRGLKVDGDAGTDTRHALIREYMSLDGASLSELAGEIEAIAHGCGENFPLDDDADELDSEPAAEKRDPSDRRVELFFFDVEFGITPEPPGETSAAGSPEYPLWRERVSELVELRPDDPAGPKVKFIELADALFRTNSAVVLPEGEIPSEDPAKHESLSSVNALALLIRLNEERPGKKLFIAGHTDSAGSEDFNQPLSQERAECALALLTGDRARFQDLCQARHHVADYKQILAWVARAFQTVVFDCDPGKIDDNAATAVAAVRRFQTDYNANRSTLGISGPSIAVDGSVGKETWGAFFDCYEVALADELGETTEGVAALRKQLIFVDDERKALGFSEHFPIEELGVDNYRSQSNRRVELLWFDHGEEPNLEHAESDPETSELYLPGYYERKSLPSRPGGAKPHMNLTIFVFRPDGARSGIVYELFNEDGSFKQTISDATPSEELDENLALDFTDVPMGSPLTLRQVLPEGAIDFVVQVPPALATGVAPPRAFLKDMNPKAEASVSFLSYDLDGALI